MPLRRRPKQLTEDPGLYLPGGTGVGLVRSTPGSTRRDDAAAGRPGGTAAGFTDEAPRLLQTPEEAALDPETARRVRQIASRLAIRSPRRDPTSHRGVGDLTSVRYRGAADDIDLDATLESLVEHPIPQDDDIIVRERVRARRSVVLAVDVSGSMRGDRIRTAAATVGALAAELVRDHLAVIAFWSDAAILAPLGSSTSPGRVLDLMTRIRAEGLTNIEFPLQLARRELAIVPARDARVVLLSDCVHNAGPDPRATAAQLPRLDVLIDTSGEHDLDLAADLARLGHGRLARAADHRGVAAALTSFFP